MLFNALRSRKNGICCFCSMLHYGPWLCVRSPSFFFFCLSDCEKLCWINWLLHCVSETTVPHALPRLSSQVCVCAPQSYFRRLHFCCCCYRRLDVWRDTKERNSSRSGEKNFEELTELLHFLRSPPLGWALKIVQFWDVMLLIHQERLRFIVQMLFNFPTFPLP